MSSQLWLCVTVLVCCVVQLTAGTPVDTVTANGNPLPVPTDGTPAQESLPEPTKGTEPAIEPSKMSRFLDDFTSAFKQGTAKMKESLESAASSVKDGVLQGYDYVRSKLSGTVDPSPTVPTGPGEDAINSSTIATAPHTFAPSTERPAISNGGGGAAGLPSDAGDGLAMLGGAVGVSHEPARIVPNDDDEDDERIFFNDKDYTAVKEGGEDERDVTESPPPATTTVAVDNRFIIAGPLACKSGQEVVNGKCRNVF